nr:hypothetical protein [Tanacetum cinerariifolium]
TLPPGHWFGGDMGLLNVTDTLNRFTTMVEHASGTAHNNVPSAGKATTSPTEGVSSSSHLKIGKYLYFSLCSGTETEEGLWKELQFSLVDNSKLNVVYLLNRRLKRLFHFYTVYKAGKRLLYVKRNKAISLEKCASKVGIEVQQLFLKDYT